jgi:hypothetical protein
MNDTLTQSHIDTRLTLNVQIGELFGSAFEDYGMDGIRYVMDEVARIGKSIQAENSDGKLIA